MAWPASILHNEIMTANERSDLGINRSQAGQPPAPRNVPPRSMSCPRQVALPMRVKVQIDVHVAFLYRTDVACHLYSCIPLLCPDIADAKFNELFVGKVNQS